MDLLVYGGFDLISKFNIATNGLKFKEDECLGIGRTSLACFLANGLAVAAEQISALAFAIKQIDQMGTKSRPAMTGDYHSGPSVCARRDSIAHPVIVVIA
jgi:hypothetical protein